MDVYTDVPGDRDSPSRNASLKFKDEKYMSRELIPQPLLDDCARRFKLLGETVRLQLINELHARGELTVQELVDATGHQQANVSKHLLIMAREGFLNRRKEGLNVYYSINNPAVPGICLLVAACLDWVD